MGMYKITDVDPSQSVTSISLSSRYPSLATYNSPRPWSLCGCNAMDPEANLIYPFGCLSVFHLEFCQVGWQIELSWRSVAKSIMEDMT
jgi:hypothetical protein